MTVNLQELEQDIINIDIRIRELVSEREIIQTALDKHVAKEHERIHSIAHKIGIEQSNRRFAEAKYRRALEELRDSLVKKDNRED